MKDPVLYGVLAVLLAEGLLWLTLRRRKKR